MGTLIVIPRGFGFVSYDTSEQLDGLLATHKDRPVVIDGNEVNIKRVFPDPESAPPTPPEPQVHFLVHLLQFYKHLKTSFSHQVKTIIQFCKDPI